MEDNGKVWLPTEVYYHRLLHDGMMARVQDDGNSSEPFLVSNGVKQGVLAPTLFSLMFSAMLTDAFADSDIGIGMR